MPQFPCLLSKADDGSILLEVYGLEGKTELWRFGLIADGEDLDQSGWYLIGGDTLQLMGDLPANRDLFTALDTALDLYKVQSEIKTGD